MRRLLPLALLLTLVLAATASQASASWKVRYGLQDDAWLEAGSVKSWSLEARLAMLDRLGADTVRSTLRWDHIARFRPEHPADPDDWAYDWSSADALVNGLHQHSINVLLTLWGTPVWANHWNKPNWPPDAASALALFATAAAKRYPWVHMWEVWNEPNQVGGLNPNSPRLYVQRLLNPTVAALHPDMNVGVPIGRIGARATRASGQVAGLDPDLHAPMLLPRHTRRPRPGPGRQPRWAGPLGCASCVSRVWARSTSPRATRSRPARRARAAVGRRRWLVRRRRCRTCVDRPVGGRHADRDRPG